MSKPVIVIDFDDTITACEHIWHEVILMAERFDQRVICMTHRMQDEQNVNEVDEWMSGHGFLIPVYFTNGLSKTLELERLGITKYILCDDNPKRAVNGV